ncbi:MAG: SEC-C metal-binding domain-containing protein, partial [Desulfitobacteriaceae bacterium]|nr:SEC-C metal-binding domain-containing protein [Desulfitobacteriaceae bacterium]
YIERAFDYCNEYADNVFLCEKTIDLVSSAYLEQYKRNPPASVMDRCYALLLRFPSSDDLISVFFNLVEQSKMLVAEWKRRYLHDKNVIAGLISNKRIDILYSEGLGEPEIVTTYVRSHPKVGANEPCPCGSGKKFKKCCRGNGRYD